MNLADAPIARDGFYASNFFTVSDQDKSKDFYVRILGGKLIKPDHPCYIKLANTWIILNSGGGPTPDKPEVLLETPSDLNRENSFLNLQSACRRHLGLLQTMARPRSALSYRAISQSRLGMALLHA